tara:strand:- start:201 stop:446 length:246 start_codon:yes stop_codon:yes gene_type:complete
MAEIAILSQKVFQMTKTKRAKVIPHYVVLKWNKNNSLVPSQQKEWEIIKEYDDTFKWDSVLYQVWYFNTHAQAKQFIYENK